MPAPRSTDIFSALRAHVNDGDVPLVIHSYRRFNTGLAHYGYFRGEMGQKFNKDAPEPVDPERVEYLRHVLDELLNKVK